MSFLDHLGLGVPSLGHELIRALVVFLITLHSIHGQDNTRTSGNVGTTNGDPLGWREERKARAVWPGAVEELPGSRHSDAALSRCLGHLPIQ